MEGQNEGLPEGQAAPGTETPPPAPEVTPPAETPAVAADVTPDPDAVPYERFREAQTERTRYRRELDTLRPELDQLKGKATTLEQQLAQVAAERDDFRAVVDVLRDNPDLYDEVKQRLNGGGAGARPNPPAAPQRPVAAPATIAGLDKDVVRDIHEAARFARSLQEREARQREIQELTHLETRVKGSIGEILTKAGYPPEALEKAVNIVLPYVVQEGQRRFGEDATEADVPFLTRQWLNNQAQLEQARSQGRIRDKQQAAALPPAVPAGGAPHVSARPPTLDSPDVREQALRFLESAGL
jgi:hypothetical protein